MRRIELLCSGRKTFARDPRLAFFWKELMPEVRKEMRGRSIPSIHGPKTLMMLQATAKTIEH